MIDRRLAVFSGIHPKVVERLEPTLRSIGIEPVVVSMGGAANADYFERLAHQALCVAQKQRAQGSIRLTSALVSALSLEEAELETDTFFPSLRRVSVRPEWRNNPAASKQIAAVVQDFFQTQAATNIARQIASRKDERLLLPPRNTPSKFLAGQFLDIYHCRSHALSAKVEKEIIVQRGGRGIRVVDLQFAPLLNGNQHPVRRCTDSSACDLKASFRFGAAVPPRFEFDVTGENGLKSKRFCLCDGRSHRVSAKATHLNMRINDDFKEG